MGRARNKVKQIAPGVHLCGVEGCAKPYCARGLCNTHYARWRKHGSTLAYAAIANGRGQRIRPKVPCTVAGCQRRRYGRGYCNLHYQRARNWGYPGPAESMNERSPLTADDFWRQAKEHGLHFHGMVTRAGAPPRWVLIRPDRNGRDNLCLFDPKRCMRIAPVRANEAPTRLRRSA